MEEHLLKVLYSIYVPPLGSIWAAHNGIWKNGFAANKSPEEHHPSVIGQISNCKTSCKVIPGTTKRHTVGTCVFKTKINESRSESDATRFLIKLWMSYNIKDLNKLKRGWDGIDDFSQEQLTGLKLQIKHCLGKDV